MIPLPTRAATKRAMLLLVDRALSLAERGWVVAAGGHRRIKDGRDVDPASGRTRVEKLQRSGVADEVWPRAQEAIQAGVDPTELAKAFHKISRDTGERLAATLIERAPQMHREHRAIARGMNRRMRAIWGPAFDAFYEVWVCAEELGSDLQQMHGGDRDPHVDALLALHARACLVLGETHALLSRGYAFGAWARTRSLHETAVLATVLSNFGREAGMEDLGERFSQHAVIDQLRDMELAERSGLAVDSEELAACRERRAELVAIYGPQYAKDYGWARPAVPNLRPKSQVSFARLEALADSGLERLDYRLGGHHVHSSAWSVVLSTLPRGDAVYQVTGPTNIGFTDPAAVALAAILASTRAIVEGVAQLPEPMNLVGLQALAVLSERAVGLFGEAQELVNEREDHLRRRLARRAR